MTDTGLRVYPVEGDGYGEPTEFHGAKYRMEPHYPGAAGDANHDLVVYQVDQEDPDKPETELFRAQSTTVLIAHSGQPSPVAPSVAMVGDDNVDPPAARSDKAGQPATKTTSAGSSSSTSSSAKK